MTTAPDTPWAGVRKPPREETARSVGAAIPRGRRGRARRGGYGDLAATDRAAGCAPSDRRRALGRLARRSDPRSRGMAGSMGEDRRARTGVDSLLLRAPSWPVENQLRRRAALRRGGSGVVMR